MSKITPALEPLGRGSLELDQESRTLTDQTMTAHVRPIEGKVVVTFPASIDYLSMPPDMAEQFANMVLDCVKAIRAPAPPGTKLS